LGLACQENQNIQTSRNCSVSKISNRDIFMAIQSIRLNEQTFKGVGIGLPELPLELAPLNMYSLGRLVVLAGPNGAGKSRLLRLIQTLLPRISSEEQKLELAKRIAQLQSSIEHLMSLKGEVVDVNSIDPMRQYDRHISTQRMELERFVPQLAFANSISTTSNHSHMPMWFVPRVPALVDPVNSVDAEAKTRAAQLANAGAQDAERNAPAYARQVLRAALKAYGDRAGTDASSRSQAEVRRDQLCELMQAFLGEDFRLQLDDSLNLSLNNNHRFEMLSDGQRVLFQFVCMLHANETSLSGTIVLMDEPENHLHPAVLNEVIDRLLEILGGGQVWIATHSVPLIAHLIAKEPDSLWYAQDGRFGRAGRSPEKVLESLMGGPDGSASLHALTTLPAAYAAVRFLSECLMPPGVAGASVADPQTQQIAKILKDRLDRGGKKTLRILDVGAGVGRLLSTLGASAVPNTQEQWFDYLALEPDIKKHTDLYKEIDAVYVQPDGRANRVFSNIHDLAKIDEGSIDVIVMCNVLHEIDPDAWIDTFKDSSPMMRALASDGYILIVEDYGIPVGERAHRYGFLLMDEVELRKLFGVREQDEKEGRFVRIAASESQYQDRLIAHLIGHQCIVRISSQTRCNAIQSLHDRMKDVVSARLSSQSVGRGSSEGRQYAREAQLFTNAAIWLSMHKSIV
jgi:ABC-type cobalamin/Fe3+-siderophores transport system ATPase subunit/SAM-dependent methyltransferase